MQVDFALLYEVAGNQIWDNDFRRSYSVSVPGSLP